METRTITFSNMKGGVGKTTCAILTANCLAARGSRMLLIDLDPNNSATMYYTAGTDGIEAAVERHNAFEALSHNTIGDNALPTKVRNVSIVPSHLNMFKLRGIGHNELQRTLRTAEGYDHIIVDTAPTYDNIVINAIIAADLILTPIRFTSFDLTTASFLQKQIYDDAPQQAGSWYLLYSDWLESHARFEDSLQSQFVRLLESTFSNILDVHIPRTPVAQSYTQLDGFRVGSGSRTVGSRRLAAEFNRLCDMITGSQGGAEQF